MPKRATREAALAAKTRHSFKPGVGYLEHEAPPVSAPLAASAKCDPPIGTRDGSEHLLLSPGGTAPAFKWVAAERAWERAGGNRLAWAAPYLAAQGWTYLRAF